MKIRPSANISWSWLPTLFIAVALSFAGCVTDEPLPSDVGSKQPSAVITKPLNRSPEKPGATVVFSGYGTKPDGNLIPASDYHWKVNIQHCDGVEPTQCHTHDYHDVNGVDSGTFQMPLDHDRPTYLEVILEVQYTEAGVTYTKKATRILKYESP